MGVLAPLPFFVGVFALQFVGLRDDLTLFEQGNSWSNTFLEVFLIDEGPMGIAGLPSDLNAFQNLLLIGFQREEILWGKHIRGTVETRQFHKLAHDFRRLQTTPQCHLHVLPMLANPLWIKGICACHWQKLRSLNHLWLAVVELDNALADRLFPRLLHAFIQDFGVDEGHFWARLCHPLLNENQAHSIVDEFNRLGLAKSMKAEMEHVALLIEDLILSRQVV
jgi:hypothetical protein